MKLADFGASNTLAMLTTLTGENRTMQGTVNWMSPEVFMGKGVGRSTDVWSLGCLAIELLTGRPPWTPPEGPTLQQVCQKSTQSSSLHSSTRSQYPIDPMRLAPKTAQCCVPPKCRRSTLNHDPKHVSR